MPKSRDFSGDFLRLFFNATTMTGLAQNATSSPLGDVFFALHTADPGSTGNQSTSEVSYTSYTRMGVARTSATFVVSGNTVRLVADLDFPASTGGAAASAAFFSIGKGSAGATQIMYSGTLSPQIPISSGATPRINAGTIITED